MLSAEELLVVLALLDIGKLDMDAEKDESFLVSDSLAVYLRCWSLVIAMWVRN